MLIDTHAHIHSADYPLDRVEVLQRAAEAGVEKILCVGTDERDSQLAVDFVVDKPNCWATVGLHPHEAARYTDSQLTMALQKLNELASGSRVVAIGECGLDLFYNQPEHLPQQERILRHQIELALKHDLPMVFHVRNAFAEFWPIFDSYQGVRGVIHSFSSGQSDINHILSRGLLVGFNGIMTFSKDEQQLSAARTCPLEQLVFETDAPFLTPVPKRGKVNEPMNVSLVAQFFSTLRSESIESLAKASSANAQKLFRI